MRRRNPHAGLVVFWVKLRQHGYTRSISGLHKLLGRIDGKPVKLPNPKYIPKPYEQMQYPGQRVQINVKFVPKPVLSDRKKVPSGMNTPSLMNTAGSGIWKPLKRTAPIRPHSF